MLDITSPHLWQGEERDNLDQEWDNAHVVPDPIA